MSKWDEFKNWFGKKKAETELEVEKKKNSTEDKLEGSFDNKKPTVVVERNTY
jgi:hypothetical protein